MNRPNLDFRGYAGTVASGRIAAGDEIVVAASGRIDADQPHRHGRWRPGGGGSRRRGDADAGRRNRCRSRRCAGEADRAAGCRRSVRGASDLDGRGSDGSGPQLYLPDRDAVGHRQHHHDQAPHRRQHPRPPRGHHARPQRDRLLQCGGGLSGRLRSLRGQPQDRLVHRDRSLHQPDHRGRDDRLPAAARHQHRLAAAHHRQDRTRHARSSRSRASSGSPGCPAPANRPLPTSSTRSCSRSAGTPCCSTATMSAMG